MTEEITDRIATTIVLKAISFVFRGLAVALVVLSLELALRLQPLVQEVVQVATTIRVCQELVAAEKEYHSAEHAEYAQKIFSDEGQHNGLYWKASDGEPQSPIGPLVASAVAEGYAKGKAGPPTPYRGYLFHVLTRQGKGAPDGAKSYIVNGKMAEGFAFVAYPSEYRSSGVMTFIVNHDGVVYQKDLDKKTEALGKAMQENNPDSSWRKAEEEPPQTTSGENPSNFRQAPHVGH